MTISFGQLGLKTALVGVLFMLLSGTAAAEDYYKQACEFYEKGEYEKARHLFSHISKHAPSYGPAHYQLGNTYLKLGKFKDAREAYTQCINNTKDATMIKHCQTAIDHCNNALTKAAAQSTSVTKQVNESMRRQARDDERKRRYEEQVAEVQKQRDAIMKEAQEKARKIREECDRHVAEAEGSTNQRLRNVVTGERRMGLTREQEEQIRHPYEEEAQRIMRIATDRARVIRMPPEPVYEGTPTASTAGTKTGDDEDDE